MKKWIILSMIIFALAVAMPSCSCSEKVRIFICGEGPPTVRVGAPDQVATGDYFTAQILANNIDDFDAANYDVIYDPGVLEAVTVTDGELEGRNVPVDMWGFIPPTEQGRIRIINNIPGIDGVSGCGYLAEIEFHVIGDPGSWSEISLADGILSDITAHEIEVAWEYATVNVFIYGDANGDHLVNALDLTAVELMIMELEAATLPADANQDGDINAIDLTEIEIIIAGG